MYDENSLAFLDKKMEMRINATFLPRKYRTTEYRAKCMVFKIVVLDEAILFSVTDGLLKKAGNDKAQARTIAMKQKACLVCRGKSSSLLPLDTYS